MLRELIGNLFGSLWGRLILIGVVVAFGFTALFMPLYNPVTRGGVLGVASMTNVWAEVNQWRMLLQDSVAQTEKWPADLSEFESHMPQALVVVRSPSPYRLSFTMRDLDLLGDARGTQMILDMNPRSGTWQCSQGVPAVPLHYLPVNCRSEALPIPGGNSGWYWLVILLLSAVIAAMFLLYRHPLILPIQRQPSRLLQQPYFLLTQLDRVLGLLGRKKVTLQAAGILPIDWQGALDYLGAPADTRSRVLALRVGARCQASGGWALPGQVQEWLFSADLPVGLDRCLVYQATEGLAAEAVVQHLRAAQTGLDVMLVIAGEHSEALAEFCADPANLFVLVDAQAQTRWLLARKPVEVFLRLLAAQLRLTRISPYQTRGGVARDGAFFGRTQTLARVLNREPSNYLVVGGRQLGKSSLLKAVQRRLQGHPHIVCHYVSLRDHRLAPRLALQFGLPAETPLEQVVTHLGKAHAGKRLFLLIDEADLFFRDEAQQGYRQLSTLRALSEEGRCWFMLAGFWDLYATAVLDYQSPLRNFGEVITIGGLEPEACRELATVPLARLRLAFGDPGLVEQLVQASGQRANLVAIICQECLEALKPGERLIGKQHLAQALASHAVQDALAGWGQLVHDEAASRLDRVIVYYTACHGRTRLADLVLLFEQHRITVGVDALKRSLSRLTLAFVLKREQDLYGFAIPLFVQQFEPGELGLFLHQELSETAAAPGRS
ncbi:MAG: ATP-binding protein [Pseudomonas sp.]|uniref:ATP-binding protein n=1 Tax=Pseudomonas sp. TaxID=306 RepID=UPI003397DF35